jgi:hypothetical protein
MSKRYYEISIERVTENDKPIVIEELLKIVEKYNINSNVICKLNVEKQNENN